MDNKKQETIASELATLGEVSRRHGIGCPDKVALLFEGKQTTYGEFDQNASRIANALLRDGLKFQGRIVYLGKNSNRGFELIYGAAKAGGVFSALNWRLAPPEAAAVLEDISPFALFAEIEFAELAESALEAQGEAQGEGVAKVLMRGTREGWLDFDTWWQGTSEVDPMVDVGLDDVAIQMYTSGTTGLPKGVQLTHRNLAIFEHYQGQVGDWAQWADDEVQAVYAPIFHVTGTAWGIRGLGAAARLVIIPDFDIDKILDAIEQERITCAIFVPAMFRMFLLHPRTATADLSSMRMAYYGASPIPLELLKKSLAMFGCGFVQLYGMTETAGIATYLPPVDQRVEGGPKMQSCGLPWPGVEIRIVDEAGGDLPAGETGEVWLKSETLMKGYWQREDATNEVVKSGWYRTGDAGWLDADGYLYIRDRVKDMIITGGENVYPAEIERVLNEHPDVIDAGVIGIPSEVWGEEIKAFVMMKPDSSADEEQLIAFARERIASYKCPRSIEIVTALPRNATGKILKTELRAPYWS